jgi:predicted transcriptional regulator
VLVIPEFVTLLGTYRSREMIKKVHITYHCNTQEKTALQVTKVLVNKGQQQ